jgi:hypothetical protein
MSEGNGRNAWIMWLVGVIATVLTTAVFTLANAVVSNDQLSRCRDDVIEERLQKNVIEQKNINQNILISLKEIETTLKYIRRDVSAN